MRRILTRSWPLVLVSLVFLVPAVAFGAAGATLPDLFQKAKQQVKLGSYEAALSTLQEIDTFSQQPGLERDRAALEPSLAFYRGVCHAALGKEEEARGEFRAFLQSNPNTRLDSAMYPKKVVAVFEEVQKSLAPVEEPKPKTGGIAAAYRDFRMPAHVSSGSEEDWADGPARFLLTPAEADEFRHTVDPIARSEFITKFWKSHDPKAETAENEFRDEFERRSAFADQYFVQGEARGSSTDRGMVFVLLGPPSSSGQRPIKTGDDTSDPAALHRHSSGDLHVAEASQGKGQSNASRQALIDAISGVGTSMNQPSANWREVWRYLRTALPSGLPYQWVDFDFISKPGYGESVLQRDHDVLDALDHAKAALPKP